ncbi:MAG: hypothetical protein R2712_30135 [Vicinamibacterales bacterium]
MDLAVARTDALAVRAAWQEMVGVEVADGRVGGTARWRDRTGAAPEEGGGGAGAT